MVVLPAILLACLTTAATAHADALQPGYLELRHLDRDLYAVTWKKPAVGAAPMAISATLPQQCNPRTEAPAVFDGSAFYARWTTTCAGGLEGGRLRVDGLETTSTDVLVRFDLADGTSDTRRLTPTEPEFVVPVRAEPLQVVSTYTLFGVEHILGGIDHLLFVLALLLLVKGVRRLVATITAFTIAHSLTLAGATLGWAHVPGPPIEAMIALSIAFVAAEIIHGRQGAPGLTERFPWLVAFTFGLLHGFGFAGALVEVGLPQQSIPLALLFFNVGVEVGQLLFIGAVFALLAVLRMSGERLRLPPPAWVQAVPPYVIGGLAMFWVIERTVAFFA